jgi:5-formyltetrahydrofolate cyclo-ligase
MHAADKQELRRRFAAARAERTTTELDVARRAVREQVLDRHRTAGWSVVAAYLPMRTEPGSLELLRELRQAGARVLVPVVLADRDLDWVLWDEAATFDPMSQPGPDVERLGVAAISAADAVLVPAFAVTRDGRRLGRGGGSYDRALTRVGSGALVAAVVFDDEVVADLPTDPWDRPVAAAVTPGGWIELHGNGPVGQDG